MELNALGFFGQPIGARRDPSLVSESGRPLYRMGQAEATPASDIERYLSELGL